MATELTTRPDSAAIEQVLIGGDLKKLSEEDRLQYYMRMCESLKLNPLTRPFEYIVLNNKLTLYARKDATDQLRALRQVSISNLHGDVKGDVYVVSVSASLASGRTDEATGAVSIGGLKGDALANAYMKAETKAKRRATLSICGLGLLDETEIETIPGARAVNTETGEIIDSTPEPEPDTSALIPPPPESVKKTGVVAEKDEAAAISKEYAAATQMSVETVQRWARQKLEAADVKLPPAAEWTAKDYGVYTEYVKQALVEFKAQKAAREEADKSAEQRELETVQL